MFVIPSNWCTYSLHIFQMFPFYSVSPEFVNISCKLMLTDLLWIFFCHGCNYMISLRSSTHFHVSIFHHCSRSINVVYFYDSYAIGGLSGGEEKDSFWRMVAQCTATLPKDKPRYVMVQTTFAILFCVVWLWILCCLFCDIVMPNNFLWLNSRKNVFQVVGYPLDIVVCSAFGVDM